MNARGERIIIFGDSLSHHGSDNAPEIWDVDAGSNRGSGQPGDLLASLLMEQGAEAVRVNARVGRSALNFWGRENFSALLDSDRQFRPTKVIVILGSNDLNVGLPATIEGMTGIRDVYKNMGAEVWGVGPFMYVGMGLNQKAVPVADAMSKIFAGRFIDPRPITAISGRSGDGMHFGGEAARVTAIQLADLILSTPGPRNWLPMALGACAVIGIGLIWSYNKNKKSALPLFGLHESVDDDDEGEDYEPGLRPAQRKQAKKYVTEAKKALKQLKLASGKVETSTEDLAELSDDANKKLTKAYDAFGDDPAFEDAFNADDQEVMEMVGHIEEARPPSGEDVRYESSTFAEEWASSMKRFEDKIGDVEDYTKTELEGLDAREINKDVSFHELIREEDPAAMDIAEDVLLERGWKMREVTGGNTRTARAFSIQLNSTEDIADRDRWKDVQTVIDGTSVEPHYGTWPTKVQKIDARWQVVGAYEAIIQSLTTNVDGRGFSSKKGATEALKALRQEAGAGQGGPAKNAVRVEIRVANGKVRVSRERVIIGADKDQVKQAAVADAWAIAKKIKPLPLDTDEKTIEKIVVENLQKPENMKTPELFGLDASNIDVETVARDIEREGRPGAAEMAAEVRQQMSPYRRLGVRVKSRVQGKFEPNTLHTFQRICRPPDEPNRPAFCELKNIHKLADGSVLARIRAEPYGNQQSIWPFGDSGSTWLVHFENEGQMRRAFDSKAVTDYRRYVDSGPKHGRREPKLDGLGGYRVWYGTSDSQGTFRVPSENVFQTIDGAMKQMRAWKRQGFWTWVEDESGNFVPVAGAKRESVRKGYPLRDRDKTLGSGAPQEEPDWYPDESWNEAEARQQRQKRKKSLGNANRDLKADEIMIAANDAALEGDYAKALEILSQRETPKIATSYKVMTNESAENGDYAEQGWEDEDGDPIEIDDDDLIDQVDMRSDHPVTDALARKAASWLKKKYADADGSFRPGFWYSSSAGEESRSHNYFPRLFTDDEQERIYNNVRDDQIRDRYRR